MTKELRVDLEEVLSRFSRELMDTFRAAVVSTLSTGRRVAGPPVAASPAAVARAARAPQGRRGPKSSPQEVRALRGRILEVLRQAPAPMSAREMLQVLPGAEGSFHYALDRLKHAQEVTRHGERRFARYWVAAARTAKPARDVQATKPVKAVKAVKGAAPAAG